MILRSRQKKVGVVHESRDKRKKKKKNRPAAELKITAFGSVRNDSPGPRYLPGYSAVAAKAPSFSFGAFYHDEKEEKERESKKRRPETSLKSRNSIRM